MISRKKLLNSMLMLCALLIWGWNTQLLRSLPKYKEKEMHAIPDLPRNWEKIYNEMELPDMSFDPFNPYGKVDVRQIKKKPKSHVNYEHLPKGAFILVLEREGYIEAVFKEASGQTRSLKEGDRIERWIVESISLNQITLKHQNSGKTHAFELP